MTDADVHELRRQNEYLKLRCAQLQGDVTDLSAENMRMRQELERVSGRRAGGPANPLSGGQ